MACPARGGTAAALLLLAAAAGAEGEDAAKKAPQPPVPQPPVPQPPVPQPKLPVGLMAKAGVRLDGGGPYMSFRMTVTKVRENQNMVQLSEMILIRGGNQLPKASYVDAFGGLDQNGAPRDPNDSEGSKKAIDGDMTTKWLSGGDNSAGWNSPLIVQLSSPQQVDGFTFATANDEPGRDPVSWQVDGCEARIAVCLSHADSWTSIAKVENQPPTTERQKVCGVTAGNAAGAGGGSGGGSSKMSGGGVFLILFFVGGFTYFVGGFAVNRYRNGKEGAEAVPHIEFWKDLPGKVKDGFRYARQRAQGGGYNSV